MYVVSSLLPKDIRLVSALGWYRLFVWCGLTRRVSRRVKADRSLSPTGEPEQGLGVIKVGTYHLDGYIRPAERQSLTLVAGELGVMPVLAHKEGRKLIFRTAQKASKLLKNTNTEARSMDSQNLTKLNILEDGSQS